MRKLIMPALFLVARLGLFLSVLAWIVGQRSSLILMTPVPGAAMLFCMESHGFLVAADGSTTAVFSAEKMTAEHVDRMRFLFESSESELVADPLVRFAWKIFPEMNVLGAPGNFGLSLPYWFVVSCSALVYIMLKWMHHHRTRPSGKLSHAGIDETSVFPATH